MAGVTESPVRCTNGANPGQDWAIVLAAGEGTRLRSLTADGVGNNVPKQFCSLSGTSLLAHTLARAATVVAAERITPIVALAHRRYWQAPLATLPESNIVVQPANRGTAIGILLPALRIAKRDPNATIVILPSDHYVADERVLALTIRRALKRIRHHSRGVALLGIEAHEPDAELGYVVPAGGACAGFRDVERFVEKPPLAEAQRLCAHGALWNSFILVCRVQSLVKLYLPRCPDVVEILQSTDLDDLTAVAEVYRELATIDFSQQIATGQEAHLAVMSVPRCGWSDLGTPRRVAQTVLRSRERIAARAQSRCVPADSIDLAERLLEVHPNYAADLVASTP